MSRRPLAVTGVLAVVGLLADLVVGYSPFPGYGLVIGLGGCIVIVIVSKWLGTAWLQRPEHYYPDDAPPDVQEDVRA